MHCLCFLQAVLSDSCFIVRRGRGGGGKSVLDCRRDWFVLCQSDCFTCGSFDWSVAYRDNICSSGICLVYGRSMSGSFALDSRLLYDLQGDREKAFEFGVIAEIAAVPYAVHKEKRISIENTAPLRAAAALPPICCVSSFTIASPRPVVLRLLEMSVV